MRATVQKCGTGLCIRIPKGIVDGAKLRRGSVVEIEWTGGMLTVRPKRRRKYTLAQLLAKARGPNPHGEFARRTRLGPSRRPLSQLVKGMNPAPYRRHKRSLAEDRPIGQEVW